MTQLAYLDESLSQGEEVVIVPDTLYDPHDSELIAMFEDLKVPFESYWTEECQPYCQ